ncbi:MAG: hypothetical protein BalsKO_20960 [Balneolaceae bacterium]
MIGTRLFLIAVFLMFGHLIGYAQKYDFKTYSVNDGLPSSFVYDVIVDEMGLIWFATANGLVKYDGKSYRNYTSEDGLNDELVNDIYIDNDNDLWAVNEFGGVFKFENNRFVNVPELSELDTVLVHYIAEGPDGKIWFGTDQMGIYEWKKGGALTQILSTDNGLPSNQIWDITRDREDKFWISTSNGIARYQQDGGVNYTLTKDSGLSGDLAYQVFEAKNGDKWIPTSDGLTIIKPDLTIETIKIINETELDYVFSISEDENGSIWIGTERKGLFIYDGTDFKQIKKRNGLSSNFIYRLVKDKTGTIWIATDGDGVSILRDDKFLIYDSSSELKANTVFSTLKHSDGSIWIGTENGISKFENDRFTNYTIPKRYFDEGEIWDIEELPNGNIVMLGLDYDIYEFDGKEFSHPEFFAAIYEYYVNDIFVDKEDGSIWFAAFEMLLKYENGTLTKFPPPAELYWQTDLHSINKDSRGYYWIGTHAGLGNFDGTSFTFLTSEDGLEGGSIYSVKEDNTGNLWVGTNKGIYILSDFDNQGIPNKIIPFETLNLYMQETIFLQFDIKGNLWQATNGGINLFDLSNWEIGQTALQKHYPFNDFGNGIEFNGDASISEIDGTLWFGSNSKGLIKVEDSFSSLKGTDEDAPKIYLREVFANNEPVYNQLNSELNNSELVLDYDESNIDIRFNGIDYKNPNRVVYRYKLEGFDTEWESSSDLGEVRYTSIPPGNYKFLVQAKSIQSSWGEPAQLASFQIQKPYWKTIPFYLVVGLTFMLVIFILVRIIAERLEKKELELLVKEKTKDLQSALSEKEVLIKEIHHRVKNNLAVISGLLELQSWNIPEGDAKNAIQESKMRVLAMSKIHENLYQNKDLARVDFRKFLEDLVLSISATMRNPNCEVEVKLESVETHINVNIGIPIGLIVNELLSNCYKHAFTEVEKGEVFIQFNDNEESYSLIISDNGKGSDENILEVKKNSLGISLVQSLCAQIGASINYNGEKGANFEFTIPKSKTKTMT